MWPRKRHRGIHLSSAAISCAYSRRARYIAPAKYFGSLFTEEKALCVMHILRARESFSREGLTRISCFAVTTSKLPSHIGRAFDCSFYVIPGLTGREIYARLSWKAQWITPHVVWTRGFSWFRFNISTDLRDQSASGWKGSTNKCNNLSKLIVLLSCCYIINTNRYARMREVIFHLRTLVNTWLNKLIFNNHN